MRKLVAALTLLAVLAAAAAALAVLPKNGAKYKGTTSAPAFQGTKNRTFKDPVTFGVSNGGRTLTSFNFGEPSCFGSGGPPPKKNPYTGKGYYTKMGSVPVDA